MPALGFTNHEEGLGVGVRGLYQDILGRPVRDAKPDDDFAQELALKIAEMPTDQHLGGLLLPAVQNQLDLLGVAPFDDVV